MGLNSLKAALEELIATRDKYNLAIEAIQAVLDGSETLVITDVRPGPELAAKIAKAKQDEKVTWTQPSPPPQTEAFTGSLNQAVLHIVSENDGKLTSVQVTRRTCEIKSGAKVPSVQSAISDLLRRNKIKKSLDGKLSIVPSATVKAPPDDVAVTIKTGSIMLVGPPRTIPQRRNGQAWIDDLILAGIREKGPMGAIEITDYVCEKKPNTHRPTIQSRIVHLMRERQLHKGDDYKLREIKDGKVVGL